MSIKLPIDFLNAKCQDLEGMYTLVSRVYYLPSRSSKAINRETLSTALTDAEYWFPPNNAIRYYYNYQGVGQEKLLEILTTKVKALNKKLAFTSDTMPNMEWLKDAILNIDKEVDNYGFLSRAPKDFRMSSSELLQLTNKKDVAVLNK